MGRDNSFINIQEAETCSMLLNLLQSKGVPSSELGCICLCRMKKKALYKWLKLCIVLLLLLLTLNSFIPDRAQANKIREKLSYHDFQPSNSVLVRITNFHYVILYFNSCLNITIYGRFQQLMLFRVESGKLFFSRA